MSRVCPNDRRSWSLPTLAAPPKTRRASSTATATEARPSEPQPVGAGSASQPASKTDDGRPDGEHWIDLLNPTETDSREAHLDCGQRIPSREDLSEVESSSRHYIENGAIYLSLPMLQRDSQNRPEMSPVGFIVTPERLVTVRFNDFRSFAAAHEAIKAKPPKSGYGVFTAVIEAIVDTDADVLEQLGDELEELNHSVFRDTDERRATSAMRDILRRLGRIGEKLGKLRHSLATLARISAFVVDHAENLDEALVNRLNSARNDVDSLAHFQEALTNKSQFLLDATLGFINIDQNDVVKVLTVWTVVGVPPTLVASIYGMNFKNIPELNWQYGYAWAWGLIVVTTLVPLVWLKAKKWF